MTRDFIGEIAKFEAAQRAVVTRAVVAGKRAALRMRQAVLSAYNSGDEIRIGSIILQDLVPLIADAMQVCHLRGEDQQRKLYPLKLATVFESTLAVLRKGRSAGTINQLQKKYNTQALRILGSATNAAETKLRTVMGNIIATGVPRKEGIAILGEAFDKLGLSPAKPFQLETIVRTQTSIAFNAGRWEADQDPDVQEILWGYEYSAVGDDRTREAHLALDGTVLPKEAPFWSRFWPPNGYNCRCTALPIFAPETVRRPPNSYKDDLGRDQVVRPDEGFDVNFGKVFTIAS